MRIALLLLQSLSFTFVALGSRAGGEEDSRDARDRNGNMGSGQASIQFPRLLLRLFLSPHSATLRNRRRLLVLSKTAAELSTTTPTTVCQSSPLFSVYSWDEWLKTMALGRGREQSGRRKAPGESRLGR